MGEDSSRVVVHSGAGSSADDGPVAAAGTPSDGGLTSSRPKATAGIPDESVESDSFGASPATAASLVPKRFSDSHEVSPPETNSTTKFY